MVLTVHHLQVSQSDRIVWLCEELGLDYELKLYKRSPIFSPPKYLALHPLGAAPVIQDGDITLAESAACAEYIINIHGNGRLSIKPGEKGYADYLYWFAFANGTLQPAIGRILTLNSAGVSEDNNARYAAQNRVDRYLGHLDNRLGETKAWLVGEEFTAADIMTVFTLTVMRKFCPWDLSKYENLLAWLKRVGEREGHRRAMEKGDPELDFETLRLGPSPPLFEALRARH